MASVLTVPMSAGFGRSYDLTAQPGAQSHQPRGGQVQGPGPDGLTDGQVVGDGVGSGH